MNGIFYNIKFSFQRLILFHVNKILVKWSNKRLKWFVEKWDNIPDQI